MLSNREIQLVEERLKSLGVETEISLEILDHLICSIEGQMINGSSFESALQKTCADFSDTEIQEINTNYIHLKRKKMLKKILIPTLFIMSLSAFAYAQLSDSTKQWFPPLGKESTANISSEFGYRIHPVSKVKKIHNGIDYIAPLGTKVFPVQEGKVIEVVHANKGYGNYIIIQHNDSIQTRYAQLHEVFVSEGDEVMVDKAIGTVGSSGTSTGPHLHFELSKKGKQINPSSIDSVFTKR